MALRSMKARDLHSAKTHAERYCRGVCDAYASGMIKDGDMELLIDEIMGLREVVAPPDWAMLGRLPTATARSVIASCGEASGLSDHTLAWLMAFVDRSETGLIGRALEAMEHYILHLHIEVPESIPLDDRRKIQTRRSFQKFYHRGGTVKFVWTSFKPVESPGNTDSEVAVLTGSFDAIVTSL
jgi:hypothetical protein